MSSRRRVTTRSVLRNPNYRRLFAAQTISRWGDTAATVALVLLLAPIAGVLVDRMPRIRVMIAADL